MTKSIVKVRANLDKDKAEEDAKGYREQYKELDNVIADIRKQKTDFAYERRLATVWLVRG